MSQTSNFATVEESTFEVRTDALNLYWTRKLLVGIVSAATVLQLIINYSFSNLAMSAMLIFSLWLGVDYSFKKENLIYYPISSMMIIGYIIYHYIIPPLGQLSELQSLTHGLHYPILVEVYDLIGLFSLLIAHTIYKKFSILMDLRNLLAEKLCAPLGIFRIPTALEFWMLGGVGIFATLFAMHPNGTSGGGVVKAVLQVLAPLTYMPYLLVNPALADPRKVDRERIRWIALMIYTVVVVAVSFITNSRTFMLAGIVSLALAYFYRVLSGSLPAPKISLKTVLAITCAFIFLTGPATNIAASMVIARKDRTQVSRLALLEQTWKIYRSGIAIKLYYEVANRRKSQLVYNEAYYNNILLNRMGNLMFADLSIRAKKGAELVGDLKYFRQIEYEKCIALLPTPLIHLLGINVSKRHVLAGSSEDFLYQEATGNPIGGFKLGSLLVLMDAMFGKVWPIIFILMTTLVFCLADALCLIKSKHGVLLSYREDISILAPLVVVTLFWYVFYFAGGDVYDFPGFLSFVTRAWIQIILMYGFVFLLVRWFSGAGQLMGIRGSS